MSFTFLIRTLLTMHWTSFSITDSRDRYIFKVLLGKIDNMTEETEIKTEEIKQEDPVTAEDGGDDEVCSLLLWHARMAS